MPRLLAVTGSVADWGWLEPVLRSVLSDVSVVVANIGQFRIPAEERPGDVYDLIEVARGDARTMSEQFRDAAAALTLFLEDIDERFDGAVVLGDRVEILAAAGVLVSTRVPIHHLFAGDMSGCLDDSFRDSISMLSTHLYGASIGGYKRCRSIMKVRGSYSMRSVSHVKFPFDVDYSIYAKLGISPGEYAVARFHPETSVREPVNRWIAQTVRQAAGDDITLLAFPPNRDTGWAKIIDAWAEAVVRFATHNPKVLAMDDPITRPEYLALLEGASWITGNSSSFVLEAPLVNNSRVRLYGNRQRGRSPVDDVGAPDVAGELIYNLRQDKAGG